MQPQTLRSDTVLSASQCGVVLQTHVSIFEPVGCQLQKTLFKKVSLSGAHVIIYALITKNPAAPMSATPLNVP